MSDLQKVKIKAILPKTANSYHQMRKGLLLTPQRSVSTQRSALQTKAKILSAYNDVVPILKSLKQQHHPDYKPRPQSRSRRDNGAVKEVSNELKQKARNLLKLDFSEIDRYMSEML